MIMLKANPKTKVFSVWDGEEKLKEFNNYRDAVIYKNNLNKKKQKKKKTA